MGPVNQLRIERGLTKMRKNAKRIATTIAIIVAGSLVGVAQTTPAGNVASGTFGSNTGGGDYTFPGNVNLGGGTAGDVVSFRSDGAGPFIGSYNGVPLRLGTAYTTRVVIDTLGRVGIGTGSPSQSLSVNWGALDFNNFGYVSSYRGASNNFTNLFLGGAIVDNGDGSYTVQTDTGSNYFAAIRMDNGGNNLGSINFYTGPNTGGTSYMLTNAQLASYQRMTINNGNVGIGTTAPGKPLDVSGTIRTSTNATTGDAGGVIYPDGTLQTTAWTGTICGGDYAESVDVTGDRAHYGPGDVLVIDPENPGKFLQSGEAYSTAVTGIYSTKPGTVGRRQATPKSSDEVPMAMVGIVPTKVSAENGPIHPGDLLVTSSKQGHAMKGTDRSRLIGAEVGKALGSLDSGTGVIEVVVTLQ